VIRKIFAALGAAIMVLATLLAAPAASAARLIVPTRLGAASQASTWPDQWQRSLQDLKVVGSEVFYGWGSYDANIGPVQVGSLNIASGAETIAFILNGEEADVLRRYGGALFVPDIDPKTSWSTPAGYATSAGGWHYEKSFPAQHIFDVARYGNATFVAGAMTNPDKSKYGPTNDLAFIAKRVDGSSVWTMEKWRATDPAVGHSGYDRYYWLAVANGKLWASATVEGRGPIIDVYSGGTWASVNSPSYWVNRTYEPHRVESNGARILGHARGTAVWVIDSTAKLNGKARGLVLAGQIPTQGTIMDLAVDGSTFYALVRGENGLDDYDEIWRSPDGISWTLVAEVDIPVPNWKYTWHNGEVTSDMRATATAIEVAGGTVYLGTNMGDVWKAAL
jgi:hypothetical protein